MNIGDALTAQEGYQCLQKDVTYYLVNNRAGLERVLLVAFKSPSKYQCELLAMTRLDFEEGLQSGAIQRRSDDWGTPPWLPPHLRSLTVQQLDGRLPRRKESIAAAIDRRKASVAPLIKESDNLLGASDPMREIGALARRHGLNAARTKFLFLAQHCFFHELTLCPQTYNGGQWNREGSKVKQGRPPKSGKGYGFPMTNEMKARCVGAFYSCCVKGVTKEYVYRRAMKDTFKCAGTEHRTGLGKIYQPEGKPFPSYWQFWYAVDKSVPRDEQDTLRFGAHHVRTHMAPSEGKYTEGLSNVLECVQLDAQFDAVRPAGLQPGEVLPPFIEVRAVCVGSGAIVGIGFGLGAESTAPYRCALFSMAIGLRRTFEIFGLSTERVPDWRGLSPHCTADRGPANLHNLRQPNGLNLFCAELTRAFDGQGKANVESRHRRRRQISEAPSYEVSTLNPVGLAREGLVGLMQSNRVSNASARLTDDMIQARIEPSPLGVHDYLLSRGRTDGFNIPFEQAVRTLLTPIKVKIRNDGAWLLHRRYDSSALRETGILRKVSTSRTLEIDGYMLDLCVRTLWVDVGGRIVEVEAKTPLADSEDSLRVSFAELSRLNELKREVAREAEEHRIASRMAAEERFERETGLKFDGHRTMKGKKPSRKSRKAAATADMEILFPGKKAA